MNNIEEFQKELTNLINKYNIESGSNTPDFIIGEYLLKCLLAFNSVQVNREKWYGRNPIPVETPIDEKERTVQRPVFPANTIMTEGSNKVVTALADKYVESGGVPVATPYTDRIKHRTQL